jgi:hypothetical protein
MDLEYPFVVFLSIFVIIGAIIVLAFLFAPVIVRLQKYRDGKIQDYKRRKKIRDKKISDARTCLGILTPHLNKLEKHHSGYRKLFEIHGDRVDEYIRSHDPIDIKTQFIINEGNDLFPRVGYSLLLLDDKKINKMFFKFLELIGEIPLEDKSESESKEEMRIIDKLVDAKALIKVMECRIDEIAPKVPGFNPVFIWLFIS